MLGVLGEAKKKERDRKNKTYNTAKQAHCTQQENILTTS